jgi:ornithine decarboxylase
MTTTTPKSHLAFTTAIWPGRTYYAVKCNRHDAVLRQPHNPGRGFEIASQSELVDLQAVGVDPADVLFSNPVKVPRHIQNCAQAGVWRFVFDSADELRRLAALALGSAVYVRIATEDAGSEVPSEGKFGVGPREAVDLLLLARHLGLRPYSITFHVGSQTIRPDAWLTPIRRSAEIMRELRTSRIQLSMLDTGGGYPATYNKMVPDIAEYGNSIAAALHEYLPYETEVVAEPGRVCSPC